MSDIKEVRLYEGTDGRRFNTWEKAFNHNKVVEIIDANPKIKNGDAYEAISELLNKGWIILAPLEETK
jgi:hypothetical protein